MTGHLSFPNQEYAVRLSRVRALMAKRGLDVLVIDEIEAMGWLSGYFVSENLWRCCVVPREGEPFLLVRSLDEAPARQRSVFADIVTFDDWTEPLEMLASELIRRGLAEAAIGVDNESHSFTVARAARLARRLPAARFIDLDRELWQLRLYKSAAEIAHMRRAAALVDDAMAVAIRAVREGGEQREVAAAAAAAFYRLGFDDGYIGPLTAGSGWGSLHGFIAEGGLEPGAVVHIELVPRLRGYTARLMRSVVVGTASDDQRRAAGQMIEIQDRQIAAMRPGACARDIDAIVREGFLAAGLRASYGNVTGYTLGLCPLASQRTSDFGRVFVPTADWILEEGMVFHMYASAQGLAMSETVAVTADGAERLTMTRRAVFETARLA